MIRFVWLITLMIFLGACAETGTTLTLEANYAVAGTQVQDLRLTATVQSARAETTLDFVGTRSALAATVSSYLEATLVLTGVPADVLATQRQMVVGSSPTPLPTPTPQPLSPAETPAGLPTPGESPTATLPAVTLNAPRPTATLPVTPTFDLGDLRLGNLVTARAPGSDGCGTGLTSIFPSDVGEVYVILPTFGVTANEYTFAARWQRDGMPIGPIYEFTPDEDAESLCVWFYVDSTDFEFIPGNYSVAIDVNGQPVTAPVPFIIQ